MLPVLAIRRFAVAFALLLLAAEVHAHDFWIEANNFTPVPGEQISLSLHQGVEFKGDTLPFIPDWFTDFSEVTAAGRAPVASMMGNDPAATVSIEAGPTLFGYQSVRAFVELDAAKFNTYLDHEGIEFLRAERKARGQDDDPAPEYFVRCAKTLVQSGDQSSDIYKEVLGYTLELIPQTDPYSLTVGDELTFKLLLRNKPAESLLLQAFTKDDPENIQKFRVDADGFATITLDRPGVWFVKAVSIQSIVGDPRALWQSYWATYLFELPPA